MIEFEEHCRVELSVQLLISDIEKECALMICKYDICLCRVSRGGKTLFQKADSRIDVLVLCWTHKVNECLQTNKSDRQVSLVRLHNQWHTVMCQFGLQACGCLPLKSLGFLYVLPLGLNVDRGSGGRSIDFLGERHSLQNLVKDSLTLDLLEQLVLVQGCQPGVLRHG